MLYNLLLDHEPLISKVRQEWFAHFLRFQFDEGKAQDLVYYFREENSSFNTDKKFRLVFADSPKQVQTILNREFGYDPSLRLEDSKLRNFWNTVWKDWDFPILLKAKNQLRSYLLDKLFIDHKSNIVRQVYHFVDNFFSQHPKLLNATAKDYESAVKLLTVKRLLFHVIQQVSNQIPSRIRNDAPFFPFWNCVAFSSIKNDIWNGERYEMARYFRNAGHGQAFFSYSVPYGDFSDFEWLSLYDALQRCGVLDVEGLPEYMDLVRANIFSWITSYYLVIGCRPPEFIKFDDRNRLHSLDGYAVRFVDGYGQFRVHGVYFDPEIFYTFFVKKRFKPASILRVRNAEQRIALIQHFGLDLVFEHFFQKRRLDRYKCVSAVTGKPTISELYDCFLDPNTFFRLLKLEDHSTHKPVILPVPVMPQTQTCIGAIAWTFGMTECEYLPKMET